MQPIPDPTTSVPSEIPSMTGLVAAFEITKAVTSSLTDQEVLSIEAELKANFNVSSEDISTTGTQTFVQIYECNVE